MSSKGSKKGKGTTSPKKSVKRATTLGDTSTPFNAFKPLAEVGSGEGSGTLLNSQKSQSISDVMVTLSSNMGEGDCEIDIPAYA